MSKNRKSTKKVALVKKKAPAKTLKKPAKAKKPKTTAEEKAEQDEIAKRIDWQNNDEIIVNKYISILMKEQRAPKLREIAEATGLNIQTVYRHLKGYNFTEKFQEYRHATQLVVNNLLKMASTGKNVKAVELWLKTFETNIQKVDVTTGGDKIQGGLPLSDDVIKKIAKALEKEV